MIIITTLELKTCTNKEELFETQEIGAKESLSYVVKYKWLTLKIAYINIIIKK